MNLTIIRMACSASHGRCRQDSGQADLPFLYLHEWRQAAKESHPVYWASASLLLTAQAKLPGDLKSLSLQTSHSIHLLESGEDAKDPRLPSKGQITGTSRAMFSKAQLLCKRKGP